MATEVQKVMTPEEVTQERVLAIFEVISARMEQKNSQLPEEANMFVATGMGMIREILSKMLPGLLNKWLILCVEIVQAAQVSVSPLEYQERVEPLLLEVLKEL
jgi:hypothetical protein